MLRVVDVGANPSAVVLKELASDRTETWKEVMVAQDGKGSESGVVPRARSPSS